jgi:ketosteroid isomerase-like protein
VSEDNVDVIRKAFDAFNRGDIPAVVGVLHQEVDWHNPDAPYPPPAGGGTQRGPDNVVAAIFGPVPETWDGFQAVGERFLDAGDHVVVTGRFIGRARAAAGRSTRPLPWFSRCAPARSRAWTSTRTRFSLRERWRARRLKTAAARDGAVKRHWRPSAPGCWFSAKGEVSGASIGGRIASARDESRQYDGRSDALGVRYRVEAKGAVPGGPVRSRGDQESSARRRAAAYVGGGAALPWVWSPGQGAQARRSLIRRHRRAPARRCDSAPRAH